MNAGHLTKILIKVYDSVNNSQKWIHFCYVPDEVYIPYKQGLGDNLTDMNSTISRWIKEDFNKDITISTYEALEELKATIRDFCKDTYPDIYLEQSTDRQGWLRVWVTKKMKEDLKANGE